MARLEDGLGKWILKSLGDRLNDILGRKKDSPIKGSPNGMGAGFLSKRYTSLDIDENPVRDPEISRELLEVRKWCRQVRSALSFAAGDVFGSTDGDDRGWTVAETLENGDRIDPEVYDLILDFKGRKFQGEYVVGGDKMVRALIEALAYGDSFIQWQAESVKGTWGITRTAYMPVFEMFRCEDELGILTHYEQRCGMGLEATLFEPQKIIQVSWERTGQYGESIYRQSLTNWADVKDAIADEADASRAIGLNPNVHYMFEGATPKQMEQYKAEYKDEQKNSVITDLFPYYGMKVGKLSTTNPDLSALADRTLQLKKEMIPPGFPIYLFPEFETSGAKDIAGQPAINYMRRRNAWCGMIATALRQLIDIELVLKLGQDEFEKRGQYRIVFPEWKLNLSEGEEDESDLPGITDLNSLINGNGSTNGKKKPVHS